MTSLIPPLIIIPETMAAGFFLSGAVINLISYSYSLRAKWRYEEARDMLNTRLDIMIKEHSVMTKELEELIAHYKELFRNRDRN